MSTCCIEIALQRKVPLAPPPYSHRIVHQALGSRLDTLEDSLRAVVVGMLKDETISCTSDMWSSLENESFISLTGHFINKSWAMKSLSLECQPFLRSHTGVAVAEMVSEMLTGLGLSEDTVEAFVTDNGANIVAGFRPNSSIRRNSCLAHTLDFVARKM